MSRHLIDVTYQSRPVTVSMGWDRFNQGVFMVCEFTDHAYGNGSFLYSTLTEGLYHPGTLDSFLAVLWRFQISIPQEMIGEVEKDRDHNAGTRTVRWMVGRTSISSVEG